MTRRRLTHVVESLEPWGTQRQLSLVARRLPREYDQRVIALRAGGETDASVRRELREAGIEVAVSGKPWDEGERRLATAWRVRNAISREAADLVHLWDDDALRLVGPLTALKRGGAFAHKSVAERRAGLICSLRRPQRDVLGLDRYLERRTLNRAAAIFVSDPTVRRLRLPELPENDRGFYGKACVLRDAYESFAPSASASLRVQFAIPPHAKLIGTACRLTPDANVRDLLFAAALLKLVHSDFRIIVCGDGPSLVDLRRFAALMRVDELTIFTGAAIEPDALIPELFAYVSPAYWDGPSREIALAQRHGVPVVAVDTPIRRAELDPERTGFLFREHDQGELTRHLHQWLSEPELHRRMGDAARERAARSFAAATVDELAARYRAVYDSVYSNLP